MIMTGDTRTILVCVFFVAVLAISVMIVEIWHARAIKREIRRRALETLQRKAELRRQKEQEAADHDLLDKVEEYRHDFDDDRSAS